MQPAECFAAKVAGAKCLRIPSLSRVCTSGAIAQRVFWAEQASGSARFDSFPIGIYGVVALENGSLRVMSADVLKALADKAVFLFEDVVQATAIPVRHAAAVDAQTADTRATELRDISRLPRRGKVDFGVWLEVLDWAEAVLVAAEIADVSYDMLGRLVSGIHDATLRLDEVSHLTIYPREMRERVSRRPFIGKLIVQTFSRLLAGGTASTEVSDRQTPDGIDLTRNHPATDLAGMKVQRAIRQGTHSTKKSPLLGSQRTVIDAWIDMVRMTGLCDCDADIAVGLQPMMDTLRSSKCAVWKTSVMLWPHTYVRFLFSRTPYSVRNDTCA